MTLAVLLALVHAVLAVTATVEKSMTSDEIAHLTAGQAYNQLGDYRLQPENGNLPQRWAALPAALAGTPLPSTVSKDWQTADVWNYGHTLYYGLGLPTEEMLFLGRAMIALFSAATGLLIFFWARALFDWKGGFLALLLYALCPAFLAHGALATSDVVMTFFFLASVGAFWRHLENPGAIHAAVSAVTFGLACVAKFSAVLLLPMFALIAAGWWIGRTDVGNWRMALRRLAISGLGHALVAWALIWLFYGFRFSPFAPALADGANYNHGWGWMMVGLEGVERRVIVTLKDWRLLPDAFLYGFTFVLQFAKQRGAFLDGDYSIHGWVRFFPLTFLWKTTLPLLLVFIATVALAGRRLARLSAGEAWRRIRPFTPLLALFGVYWLKSLTIHLNIGHRHILPTYPVLFIAAGALGAWLDWRRPLAFATLALLVGWHGWESARIRPHYLAYFNPIAGGPANGWRRLVDSSLDWGQDLPGLKHWLDEQARGERVFLAYFGTGDPTHEGIRATLMPTLPDVGPPRPWHVLAPGIYAVSATMLQHVYSPIRGDWTLALEKEFQELRPLEPLFVEYQTNPQRRAALLRDAPAEKWTTGWKRFELLRFARLCHYLRVKPAEASIGFSIRVYRLRADELAAATSGSIKDWQRLIERTVEGQRPGS